jgi:hypothetical protein
VTEKINSRPWNDTAFFESFEEAEIKRQEMISLWSSDEEKYQGMQVKIRRRANGKFLVKIRLHPDFDIVSKPKKKVKKRGKNSRRNRANSERRMFDASAVV